MRRSDELKASFKVEQGASGVAVVQFDIPGESVNTIGEQVGREFTEILRQLVEDDSVRAAVLLSGKADSFIAGADVRMLQRVGSPAEAERLARSAQALLDQLEACRLPFVAAIHGACLGAGLEWALACSYRLATDHRATRLGLPEVKLGLIPAAGGTQRLPRLIGVQSALDLILTGKQVSAPRALRLGVVDEVVPAPLLREVAERRAAELADGTLERRRRRPMARLTSGKPVEIGRRLIEPKLWQALALEENPLGRSVLFREARKKVAAQGRGHYPAPLRAIDAVRAGLERGRSEGMAMEARSFGELATGEIARELMGLFSSQTALKKDPGVDRATEPRRVEKIAVLGAGLMGSGIAYVSLEAGYECRLKDRDAPSVARGLAAVRGMYDDRVKRRSLPALDRDGRLARLTGTTDLSGIARVDLVIEAVYEDLELKRQVLHDIESVCRPETVFASNTSSIPIRRIAEASRRPENVLGMHYFSPVQKMPLLEVIVTERTAPEATATAVAVGKRQGKTVIVVRDGPGFYTSRILAPYLNETGHLIAEGVSPLEIDQALVEWGFPVGPVTLLDEVGLDVAVKAGKVLRHEFGERMAGPAALEALVADGRLGRKAKKGFFRYDPNSGKKLPELDETFLAALPGGAPPHKEMSRPEIAERVALAMVNEAMRCLGEQIVRSPRDGDIGAVLGLGFPPFRGGPFRYVDHEGAGSVLRRIESLGRHGTRFNPAPLLQELGRSGRKLY